MAKFLEKEITVTSESGVEYTCKQVDPKEITIIDVDNIFNGICEMLKQYNYSPVLKDSIESVVLVKFVTDIAFDEETSDVEIFDVCNKVRSKLGDKTLELINSHSHELEVMLKHYMNMDYASNITVNTYSELDNILQSFELLLLTATEKVKEFNSEELVKLNNLVTSDKFSNLINIIDRVAPKKKKK